jgi:cell division protein FtsW
MGTRILRDTTVAPNPLPLAPAARKTPFFRFDGSVDFILLVIMIIFVVFGMLMVYSASWDYSFYWKGDSMYQFNRQLIWMALGITLATAISFIDYQHLRKLALPIMFITIGLLSVVLFSHETGRALSKGSIQPSEFAKVITIIYLSVWMDSKREQLHDVSWGLIPLAVIIGFICALIFLQPDNSAAFTVLLLGGLLFFLGGGELKQILFVAVMVALVVVFVVKLTSSGQSRMEQFLLGLQDLTKAGYHISYSFKAIVNGGLFGVGIGRATTKLIGLPFAPTDSIFAVIAEELGLFGAAGTVLLYVALVWRGLRIAYKAPDMLGSLIAAGLTFWIGIEAVINILVMVGLAPFAGNALPFISYGGSSLVSSFIAIGILMSVSRQTETKTEFEEWSNTVASIDMRGRNRRRSLSRISRP